MTDKPAVVKKQSAPMIESIGKRKNIKLDSAGTQLSRREFIHQALKLSAMDSMMSPFNSNNSALNQFLTNAAEEHAENIITRHKLKGVKFVLTNYSFSRSSTDKSYVANVLKFTVKLTARNLRQPLDVNFTVHSNFGKFI